jgi:hypothetical protein
MGAGGAPLILVFTLVGFWVTVAFGASVDAQGGAYATGVLVVITSAAVAVTLSARRVRRHRATWAFGALSAVFVYTTIANVLERPEGVKIASLFIAGILGISFVSRLFAPARGAGQRGRPGRDRSAVPG